MAKRERAKKAFESPWLHATERELQECSLTLPAVLDRDTRALMEAYKQVLQDKLKNHHQNLGTIKCEFALEASRRWCCTCAEGLLKKEDRHLATTLLQTLLTVYRPSMASENRRKIPKRKLCQLPLKVKRAMTKKQCLLPPCRVRVAMVDCCAKTTTAHYLKQCSERVQLGGERDPTVVSPDTERLGTL